MQQQSEVHARALARRVFDLCTDYAEVELIATTLIRAAALLQPSPPRAFLTEFGGELAQLHDADVK